MAEVAQYDLTSVIGSYLDRHLVFPMLEFLSEKKVRCTCALAMADCSYAAASVPAGRELLYWC